MSKIEEGKMDLKELNSVKNYVLDEIQKWKPQRQNILWSNRKKSKNKNFDKVSIKEIKT